MNKPPLTPAQIAMARAMLIYQDKTLLAFDKPAGLASQGGSGVDVSLDDLLAAFAKPSGKVPWLIHRLDRDTSGVIVAGRTRPAAAQLSKAFSERKAQKTYLAVVCGGAPSAAEGVIDQPLRKVSRQGAWDIMTPCAIADPGAQAAVTHYETLASQGGAALLALRPETGRMHQLRAHLAHIGHPIAGDAKYGGLFVLESQMTPRLLLHAARLTLPHPAGGEATFLAHPPQTMIDICAALSMVAPKQWKVRSGRV